MTSESYYSEAQAVLSDATVSLMRMSEHNHHLREQNALLYTALVGLRDAVTNHHQPSQTLKRTVARHRSEWPYLWDQIDQALDALYGYEQTF